MWVEPATSEQVETTHNPCPRCSGTGYQTFYKLVLPSGYFWTTDVLNCIALSELAALSAEDRTKILLVISLAVCNLNIGSVERTLLLSIFGVGSTTRANLVQL